MLSASKDTRNDLKIATDTNVVKTGATYTMKLTDSAGKAVAGKKLVITYDKTSCNKTTDSSGKFSIKLTQSASKITLNITFKGDNTYLPFSKLLTVHIVDTLP